MIIDVHYHQIPMMPEDLIPHTLEDPMRAAKHIGLKVDMAQLKQRAKAYWSDPDVEKLIAATDEADIDFVGVEKILFGTDDPILKVIRSPRQWIEVIQNLPKNAPDGIDITEKEVNAILGGNAKKLLGL